MANHVLYLWHQPLAEMSHIHDCLRSGGLIALVHPLRHNMPPMAQKRFPQDGHLLYSSDDEVDELTRTAGFTTVNHLVKGPPAEPQDRLVLAVA